MVNTPLIRSYNFSLTETAVCLITLFNALILLKPSVCNHFQPLLPFFYVNRYDSAQGSSTVHHWNLAPDACANFNVSWNNFADTPALK